jgi:16S rRNA (uracil1498-N3)-methyltransferase
MRQFVLPPSWESEARDGLLVLRGRDAKRLATVLRLQPLDRFPALAPDGRRFLATVAAISGAAVELRLAPTEAGAGFLPDIRAGREAHAAIGALAANTVGAPGASAKGGAEVAPASGLPRLVLAVGLLKGSKLDEVARAAAEAGASALVALATSRAAPRGEYAGRMDRLRRVMAEALGQSGSAMATALIGPLGIEEFIGLYPAARQGTEGSGERRGIVFHELPLGKSSLHRYCTGTPAEIVACVGPEGGFSDEELGALKNGGYQTAWLGPTVLRAETAALFALASIRILCLERSSWITTRSDG